ncbi:hypothetical protein ASG11_10465 [Sphingomonas sp. Leaf357]|uniref:hypothetical protein n=1 Tax=Sphingomonas sp. Leaf357 TaxID=1736350 RepID=UPI000701A42B|nr:hypothetical protein [Sphingomonas sp. Leaf357]KQS04620.1 hypothetical protein ASG11_10465 [Sphingomonas sp. Leaf357]
MPFTRILVLVVGVVAVAMGLLWVGQGLGYVHWPAKGNFMLDQREWAVKGALLALLGVIAIWWSRRR